MTTNNLLPGGPEPPGDDIPTDGPEQPLPPAIYRAPIISLHIVRDAEAPVPEQIRSPQDMYNILKDLYADLDREVFVVIALDIKNKVIGLQNCFTGSLDTNIVTMREIFKYAILANAAAIILAHNHPSGSPDPSPDDIRTTQRIIESGKLLGIDILDHIILGYNSYTSMRTLGVAFKE